VILACVTNGLAEMAVLYLVPGGLIHLAGRWVDDAFGFIAGWNFFFYEALSVPFETTALIMVLKFWRDDIPAHDGPHASFSTVASPFIQEFSISIVPPYPPSSVLFCYAMTKAPLSNLGHQYSYSGRAVAQTTFNSKLSNINNGAVETIVILTQPQTSIRTHTQAADGFRTTNMNAKDARLTSTLTSYAARSSVSLLGANQSRNERRRKVDSTGSSSLLWMTIHVS
jgi:hypothetical protein